MSTFETPAVDAALLQRINHDLRVALSEAGKVLADAGVEPGLAWRSTLPFLPLMTLLRSLTDAPPGALPSAEDIQTAYVERQPLHICKVLPLAPRVGLKATPPSPDGSAGPGDGGAA